MLAIIIMKGQDSIAGQALLPPVSDWSGWLPGDRQGPCQK